jgi:hypothetical protein
MPVCMACSRSLVSIAADWPPPSPCMIPSTPTGQRPVNGICNSGPIGPVNPQGPGFNPSGPASSRPWIQQIGQNPAFNPGNLGSSSTGPGLVTGPGGSSGSGNGPAGVGPLAEGGPARPGRVCACPLIYAPVCGVDGRSYPTKCAADCIGVRIASQGNC